MSKASNEGWAVAAGHPETAKAASEILEQGGNAFDAAITAMLAACTAEPVLASLGGGGFLTAYSSDSAPIVYDFFAQTPSSRLVNAEIEFYPIKADFGTAHQVFHIGMGSIAVPGFIRGLFDIHKDLCSIPLKTLIEPAISLARSGVRVNHFQHLISQIISPILRSNPAVFELHQSPKSPTKLIEKNELQINRELADFMELLVVEGANLFYQGEAGKILSDACMQNGGHLKHKDLIDYQAIKRLPLTFSYHKTRIISNPLPSLGGTLLAFALGHLEEQKIHQHAPLEYHYLKKLTQTMRSSQEVRSDLAPDIGRLLSAETQQKYLRTLKEGCSCKRGTTQISIADAYGNFASMTLSNGEGSGYVLPGSGIMLNNMLGEEDLNPKGFQSWPCNQRMSSMMAPTLLFMDNGNIVVTGSGGSNRIRSAILQVITNLVDFNLSLDQAVSHSRIHYESGLLSMEPGFSLATIEQLKADFPKQQHWEEKSLFFGGTHSVLIDSHNRFYGVGDERRGGYAITA